MSGYNAYYWYDMVLDTPNAYIVESSIYKCCGSPAYFLGRLTGFGAAIYYRSLPILLAVAGDFISIGIFHYLVERPFVRKMYDKK